MSVPELTKGAWANLSQSVLRLACNRGEVPTITQNSLIYSYEHNVTLSGAARMQLIGWTPEMVPQRVVSDHQCFSLAGDAFWAPLATIMQTACAIQPWAPWHRLDV